MPFLQASAGTQLNLDFATPREHCLMIGGGLGVQSECGDLRVAHALPSVRTANQERVPTLIYSSATADPHLRLGFETATDPDMTIVGRVIRTSVFLNGNGTASFTDSLHRDSLWFAGTGTTAQRRRMDVAVPVAGLATGLHTYTVRLTTDDSASFMATATGSFVVVNRSAGPFGAGWWLAGLEQLIINTQTSCNWSLSNALCLWVGGDGSSRVYSKSTITNQWVAPSIDRPDTLKTLPGIGFERRDRGGVVVSFDLSGRHVKTRNRLGHETIFAHTGPGGALSSITVPFLPTQYQFNYVSGVLNSVSAPHRSTGIVITPAGARIQSIRDPDNLQTTFAYGIPARPNVITARTNKRNFMTTVDFDTLRQVSRFRTTYAGRTDSVAICRASLNSGSCAYGGIAPEARRVLVNQPRSFVAVGGSIGADPAFTWYHLNRFHQPTFIGNAENQQDTLSRADARFPALVTEWKPLAAPGGYRRLMTYDAQGNPATMQEVNPYGTGASATWQYKWDPRFDVIAKITPPAGPVDTAFYDTDGNKLFDQRGTDAARRVTYTYNNPFKLLSSVQLPVTTGKDSIEYDARGNTNFTRSPLGYWTRYGADFLGRDTTLVSTIDRLDLAKVNDAARVRETRTFDAMDRLLVSSTVAPAAGRTVSQTVGVTNTYWPDGALKSVARSLTPAPPSGGSNTIQFDSDPFGRRTSETDPTGNTELFTYGNQGTLLTRTTRLGDVIVHSYDRLARLTQRVIPEKFFTPAVFAGLTFPLNTLSPGGIRVPADIETFAYNWDGGLLRALNKSAQVFRTHYPNGRLQQEEQHIGVYDTLVTDFTQHVYTLAYTYDLTGRRLNLGLPSGESRTYAYHPQSGDLQSITSGTFSFSYLYDQAGRVVRHNSPGSVSDTITYDADGRRRTRHLRSGSTTLQRDTLAYDARDRVLSAYTFSDSIWTTYSGAGAVDSSRRRPFNPVGADRVETFNVDPLGNVLQQQFNESSASTKTLLYNSKWQVTQATEFGTASAFTYDNAGNTIYSGTSAVDPHCGTTTTVAKAFYRADGRLHVRDRQSNVPQPFPPNCSPSPYLGWYEEFRYDALGRRVLRRAQRQYCTANVAPGSGMPHQSCPSAIERFVWDGDALVQETRYPGATGLPTAQLETDTGYVSKDSLVGPPATPDTVTAYSPYWGRVTYAYGHGMDAPVWLTKTWHGLGTISFPPEVLFPFRSWRGLAAGSTTLSGGLDPASYNIQWPEPQFAVYGWQTTSPSEPYYFGSVVRGMQESAGLAYKRNRYYDPRLGRFTQEDPIGLAGGLNLYGYANGDPVNFSDPFGLFACPPYCDVFQQLAAWAPAMKGALAGFAVGSVVVGAGAAAVGGGAVGGGITALNVTARSGAASVAAKVASATGGVTAALAKSEGFRVTVSAGGRDIVARIKESGEFRVAIEGLGALTREGALSSDRALTHLREASAADVIRLINQASELLRVRK